jgi:type II restriction enzyme
MKLGFEESQIAYTSGSQNARTWTEAWVSAWAYCPHCGNAKMSQFPNNSPLADFLCGSCNEEFELKSQKGKFGAKVADGAYKTKCARLAASNNPNLLLMNYDLKSLSVVNLLICAKTFLRARYHPGAKAIGGDRASRGLGRIEYLAGASA